MSLLGRRKPVGTRPGFKPRGRKDDGGESLSRRKPAKPRIFQISETELDIGSPLLGGSEAKMSSSKLDSESVFSFATPASSASRARSTGAEDRRSRNAEIALACSKLTTLDSEGPVEPNPRLGKRKLKAAKKYAKSLTKGPGWFDMAKVEITKEKKNDLEALKLRSAMEGVLHYKRNNMTHTPKYFHVGTVKETSADFYSSRIPRKQRKKTLAQEFAADFGMD